MTAADRLRELAAGPPYDLPLFQLAPDLAAWAADAADMVFNQVMAGGVQCECGDCEVCDGEALLARLDRITEGATRG